LLAVAHTRTTTRQRVELLADEVLGELYDWPIIVPSNLVYFARTAALIEGLGTHYDPHFNALAFATPIALSLRSRIARSLYGASAPPAMDAAWMIGTAIGTLARIIRERGSDLVDSVRTAVQRGIPSTAPTLQEPVEAANGSRTSGRITQM
jgi:predicted unusual protein kinase regulating ubiquinone biosynthesis (AarF/ABC1/UbiB family)